ncbi:C3a anaphylatoxin chemotactic receptor [Labeo rohita]|uniref:C3a anaphylatoxin chemotactic receptor n=1 Tax=Labeo rohita TaxID=84645 RepID=A0ABQ8MIL3_LABRO|nr:leukotriene B4 receptor 1 [Labeo rohita]KAI2662594.1 C3a anaphylatoxin chemotactic receptor [Labeo rohita]
MNSSSFYSDNDTVLDSRSSAGISIACVILGVCFLVGTPGNLLVMWTILKHVKQRSHTVLLILHLAAADLLVLITLPLWIYSLAHSWVFGEAACKAMAYIINACMFSSVFIITIMSVERFLAVRYPLKMLYWQNGMSMSIILAVTWTLSFIFGIPVILTQYLDGDDDGVKHCFYRDYGSISFEVFCLCLETLLGFIFPFLTLAICYCQVVALLRKVHFRVKKSLFLICGVVVAFILCWLPYHILNVVRTVMFLVAQSDEESQMPDSVVFISGALAFISSSINPVLYVFASKNFHGSLKKSGIVKLFQDLTAQTQQMTEGLQDSGLQDGKILEGPSSGEQRDLTDL